MTVTVKINGVRERLTVNPEGPHIEVTEEQLRTRVMTRACTKYGPGILTKISDNDFLWDADAASVVRGAGL